MNNKKYFIKNSDIIFITFEDPAKIKLFIEFSCVFDLIKNYHIGKQNLIHLKKIKFRRNTKNFADEIKYFVDEVDNQSNLEIKSDFNNNF